MRFNSTEYLDCYKQDYTYPRIHDAIVEMIAEYGKEMCGVDLCCSHGLLGQRLMRWGYGMIGIEGDAKAIANAANVIDMDIFHVKITPATIDKVKEIIFKAKAKFIVARRCLPELFGNDLEFGAVFFKEMHSIGIKEVFLEGRIPTKNAVNALSNIEAEIKLISEYYKVKAKYGNLAYLIAK